MSGPLPIHTADEERVAADMSRELETLAAQSGIRPPLGFADRVMAAVAEEPLPQPARAFRVALVGGRLGAALASVGDAWRVVVGGSTPLGVRAQALALVLVVTIGSLAVAGGAAVGAIDLLTANPPTTPSPTTPLPNELQPSPSPSPNPSPSPSPDRSPNPSPSPSPDRSPDGSPTPDANKTPALTKTPGATQRPATVTPRPTGTDDHDGSGGGGDDSGGGDQTPSPTATGTDDHGGGDD